MRRLWVYVDLVREAVLDHSGHGVISASLWMDMDRHGHIWPRKTPRLDVDTACFCLMSFHRSVCMGSEVSCMGNSCSWAWNADLSRILGFLQ
ncbi:hypothetical protein KC19_VG152100 [Ceratodon purpureus]|uniref:Uncharacterized protein n=1 Tax=Ceratodon purpureus TaxID=3225 RepID=A0A8T0HQR5_CERPU|nr:hypothetical protein KC19_VG152100 [Ceratodon purpureus]